MDRKGGMVVAANSKRRGSMRDTVTQTEIRHASQTKSEREVKRARNGVRERQVEGWTGQTGPEQGWAYAVRVDSTVDRALYPRGP